MRARAHAVLAVPRALVPRFGWLVLAWILALSVACGSRAGEPPRPASVPAEAFWVGGADGGVFVTLSRAANDPPHTVRARIFYPHGEMWFAGRLAGRPGDPPVDLAQRSQFTGWDGESLHLRDGRALKRAR